MCLQKAVHAHKSSVAQAHRKSDCGIGGQSQKLCAHIRVTRLLSCCDMKHIYRQKIRNVIRPMSTGHIFLLVAFSLLILPDLTTSIYKC